MKLTIDIATSRRNGKLHAESRVLNFCDEFKVLPEVEQLAFLAMIANDLDIVVKKGQHIMNKKAGMN